MQNSEFRLLDPRPCLYLVAIVTDRHAAPSAKNGILVVSRLANYPRVFCCCVFTQSRLYHVLFGDKR
jgi:hypothetical protein